MVNVVVRAVVNRLSHRVVLAGCGIVAADCIAVLVLVVVVFESLGSSSGDE